MKVSIRKLRVAISDILLEDAGMHRCMNGSIVPEESETCLSDVCDRIDDATYHRDICCLGTDQRMHLNGLLSGLRKKRRRLTKDLIPTVDSVENA